MHELSVCLALLDEVACVARESRAICVRSITVRIGPLSGVDAGLLARAFEVVRIGGVAENAELRVAATGVRIRCRSCDAEGQVRANSLLCPMCGADRTQVIEGDELTLSEMELDVPAGGTGRHPEASSATDAGTT